MIPQEKTDAVTRAVREAFGVAEFEDISKVTGGHTSSLVFRIIVRGSPYLLKLIMHRDDPARHYTSMRAAAEVGLAPRVWYTNIEDKTLITDFVAVKPLRVSEARMRLPAVLRALHSLPPFGRAPFNTTCTFLLDKGPARDGFLQKFQAANVLPQAAHEEFFARYAEMAAVYPYNDPEMVSSHNDLFKPDNILFDGERLRLVDWEAAFLNDRYADLAVVANQIITNDEEELAYLEAYFGAPPDHYQRARFYLMQQLSHLFYTMAFLYQGASAKSIDWNAKVPNLEDCHKRMWEGTIDLSDNDAKILYGRVHWDRLLQNVRQARYSEALRIVSDHPART
jgi:aminoglycoside phosphotransferase (APT) family kinase protein